MRHMWKLTATALLFLPAATSAAAQEEPHMTLRQIEAIYAPGDKHPPLTKDGSPAVDGMNVVFEGEEGAVYELHPAIATDAQVATAEPTGDAGSPGVHLLLDPPAAARLMNLTAQMACLRDRGDEVRGRLGVVVDGTVVGVAALPEPSSEGGDGVECGTGITNGRLDVAVNKPAAAERLAKDLGWTPGGADEGAAPEDGDDPDRAPLLPIVVGTIALAAAAWFALRRLRKA